MSESANRLSTIALSQWRNLLANLAPESMHYRVVTSISLLLPCFIIVRRILGGRAVNEAADEGAPGDVSDTIGTDAVTTDPSLLKKFSSYHSYSIATTGYTYPSIRTFYREHSQGDKLPTKPRTLPLLVFIHGLGGSIAQFHTLIASLTNCADCLAIDLPGCGLSRFAPRAWEAYTTESLIHLLAKVIDGHRKSELDQKLILICHSMGCSLGALLASKTSPHKALISDHVQAIIPICPVADPPTEAQVQQFKKFFYVPGAIFDIWRRWDRRGGTESASVARFTGFDAEEETKKLQVRFNEQSRTPVWRRMAYGTLPEYVDGEPRTGLPGKAVWSGLECSVFVIAGESDPITKAENVKKIAAYLGHADEVVGPTSFGSGDVPETVQTDLNQNSKTHFRALILPAPASHALLYAPKTARPLAGHIQSFLTKVDYRLSLGWQLQHLSEGGKWDVKNLAKWQSVEPVSKPIDGLFRAMKTLREVDPIHSPNKFIEEWSSSASRDGKDGLGPIVAVVDISHETPVYDVNKLEAGGIAYRKFPTVSKLPPSVDEVKSFIELIDIMRNELSLEDQSGDKHSRFIAVHCHYGFNRTGFLIIAYLIERFDWPLDKAIQEFARARPPGVRHAYFIDQLHARYWTHEQGSK